MFQISSPRQSVLRAEFRECEMAEPNSEKCKVRARSKQGCISKNYNDRLYLCVYSNLCGEIFKLIIMSHPIVLSRRTLKIPSRSQTYLNPKMCSQLVKPYHLRSSRHT